MTVNIGVRFQDLDLDLRVRISIILRSIGSHGDQIELSNVHRRSFNSVEL